MPLVHALCQAVSPGCHVFVSVRLTEVMSVVYCREFLPRPNKVTFSFPFNDSRSQWVYWSVLCIWNFIWNQIWHLTLGFYIKRLSYIKYTLLCIEIRSVSLFTIKHILKLEIMPCFVDRCLYFFFWSLCFLLFFEIRILIAPLVSSSSSFEHLSNNQ